MHQAPPPMIAQRDHRPTTVAAPQSWDGIGQALRSAYRDHRPPPQPLADMLGLLDRID